MRTLSNQPVVEIKAATLSQGSSAIDTRRDYSFDFMRAVAILCVLIIHSAYGYQSTSNEQLISDWLTTFARPCIAIFLFVSGYFFLSTSNRNVLIRRIERVIVPYLIFSIIALLYQSKIVHIGQVVSERPFEILANLVIGNTWGIYWFIPVIITNYILGWHLLRKDTRSALRITVYLFVINILHVTYYNAIISHFNLENNSIIWIYSYRFYLSWPFYFFLGIVAREYNLRSILQENKIPVIVVWFAIFIAYNILFALNLVQPGGYNSIIDTLASISAIALLSVVDINSSFLNFVGKVSYTIYLTHYFFISAANRIALMVLNKPPFWFSIIIFLAALCGPLTFCWIAKYILGHRARQLVGV